MTEPVRKKREEEYQQGSDMTLYGENIQKTEESMSEHTTMDPLEIKLVKESNQLLNLLPEVIWLQVMDQLSDNTSDLEVLSNASPYFRKLLLPKMVLYQFPLVLKFCFLDLLTIDATIHSPVSCLRTVCKSWNKIVDSFEQEMKDDFRVGMELDSIRRNFMGGMSNYFDSCESVQLYIKHFEDTHAANCERSPFVIRDVEISFTQTERHRHQDFVNQVTNLLRIYGHHIWNLRLTNSVDLSYLNLRHWLMSLVNLKSLHFDRKFPHLRPLPGAAEMQQLKAEIKEHPLSNLKSLHTLDTYRLPLSAPLFNEIIRNCDQISTLQFGIHPWWRSIAGRYVLVPLPNLSQLQVCFQSWQDFANLGWNQVRRGITQPLRLSLSADSTDFVQWSDFFGYIQDYWGHELVQLSVLEMPRARNEGDSLSIQRDTRQFRLELPRLRHLELVIPDKAHLDFLLGTKDSLKSLNIVVAPKCQTSTRSKQGFSEDLDRFIPLVEFGGKEENMLESNIWELFPNLDNLTVNYNNLRRRQFVYTRAQWERFIRRQSNVN